MEQPGRILIVDDEAVSLRNLSHLLKKEGYEVTTRQTGPGGLQALLEQPFDLVLTDLRMDQVDGMEILRRSRERSPSTQVVVITAYASLDSAVEAMKAGAFHYIAKPFRLDEVRQVVQSAMEMARLKQENQSLRQAIEGYRGRVNIVTQDPGMQRLLEVARQVAPTDCNLVITGESGTGKELLARYLHLHSRRAQRPFVAVNCGALQEELLASELFGYEKGAFTGADSQKIGLIEVAEGGSLFLDEVTEMSTAMQVKLLRVIQERELLRVGGLQPRKVDVRFLAATNRDLKEAVAGGSFRQDLYYRLNVVELHIPSLVERRHDIPLLAYFFLKKHALLMDKPVTEISQETMQLLTDYDYPGNVRELANLIERGVALATGETLEPAQLPENLRDLRVSVWRHNVATLPTLESQEAEYIKVVLERTGGNRTKAAEILGIDRVSLWRKLKKFGLE